MKSFHALICIPCSEFRWTVFFLKFCHYYWNWNFTLFSWPLAAQVNHAATARELLVAPQAAGLVNLLVSLKRHNLTPLKMDSFLQIRLTHFFLSYYIWTMTLSSSKNCNLTWCHSMMFVVCMLLSCCLVPSLRADTTCLMKFLYRLYS